MSDSTSEKIILTISPAVRKKLDRLLVISESDSMGQLIRRALAVYDELITRKRNGYDVVLANPTTEDMFKLKLAWSEEGWDGGTT